MEENSKKNTSYTKKMLLQVILPAAVSGIVLYPLVQNVPYQWRMLSAIIWMLVMLALEVRVRIRNGGEATGRVWAEYGVTAVLIIASALWLLPYRGAVGITSLYVLSVAVPYVGSGLFPCKKTGKNILRLAAIAAVILFVAAMAASMPSYTYEEAKTDLETRLEGQNVKNIPMNKDVTGIYYMGNWISSQGYYFRYEIDGELHDYMYSPYTGSVSEITEVTLQ